MSNRLTRQLDIDYPIIQAPMAGVSTPELAAAVSDAGALGSLGLGSSTVEQAEALINHTRRLTTRPFNVNVFCHAPAIRDPQREAQWLARLRPEFARFGGLPPETLAEIYLSFCSILLRRWSASILVFRSEGSLTGCVKKASLPWRAPPAWRRRCWP